MLTPHGAYAEYAIAKASTTFHIPEHTTFEEAATIPLVTFTAGQILYQRLGLPLPWQTTTTAKRTAIPLIVYGASSALGGFVIKLAKLSNIHPILAVAGGSAQYVREELLEPERGDRLFDYRAGEDVWTAQVTEALGPDKCYHAVDCISDHGSWAHVAKPLAKDGPGKPKLSVVSGRHKYDDVGDDVQVLLTYVGSLHEGKYPPTLPHSPEDEEAEGDKWFGFILSRFIAKLLVEGRFSGHPYDVIPGGLNGVGDGLKRLHEGKSGGKKLVYRYESRLSRGVRWART
jgi:NADPH2:quinone reductase